MFDSIQSLIGDRGAETVVRECRRCGTTVDPGVQTCPSCGSTGEIAEYEIQ